jgi:aspartate aminotransferase
VISAVRHSATLAANEKVRSRIAAGEDVLHLAFGEAGLPVHPALAETLSRATSRTGYPTVTGDPAARTAVAGYFARRGLTADPERVLLAPGSKALLYALTTALPGDVVLPQPSWVSYAAQAALAGKETILVPIPNDAGGVPDPERLEPALAAATRAGRRPGILVLTTPDNPTGTIASDALLRSVCAIAERHRLVILADQIYADLTHTGAAVTSPAALLPSQTIVTTGLSKNLALGGWRIGTALLPGSALGTSLRESLVGIASEIWSALPGPMQEVVTYAFAEPPELVSHVASARRLHGAVARAAHAVFVGAGAGCRPPQGGFYLYPDFTGVAPASNADELADALLRDHGVAVLPGTAFGDRPDRLTFRAATSLLYGRGDDLRWEALRSDDPVRLPWIGAALDRLRTALMAFVR